MGAQSAQSEMAVEQDVLDDVAVRSLPVLRIPLIFLHQWQDLLQGLLPEQRSTHNSAGNLTKIGQNFTVQGNFERQKLIKLVDVLWRTGLSSIL